MLLDSSVMQSSGGDSVFLKTRLCILFDVISYVCLYFDIAFLMLSFVNDVVIFLASLLAFLAIVARLCIHSSEECLKEVVVVFLYVYGCGFLGGWDVYTIVGCC